MMTKNSFFVKRLKLIIILFLLINKSVFAAAGTSNSKWILAAEKFNYKNPQNDTISKAITMILPSRILDNMGTTLYRTITLDEQFQREANTLKNERLSLFLQLSSEIKKRDNFVIGNYTEKELKLKIKNAEEKIQEIKDKINDNLTRQKELENQMALQENNQNPQSKKDGPQSELDKYANLFKNIISKDEETIINEKISLYHEDSNSLYTMPETVVKEGYTSKLAEAEMLKVKINGLLSGEITSYGEYLFVTVKLYIYPGAKLAATISEVGTIDEMDFISQSIARQLIPTLTNSMPITISVNVQPENIVNSVKMYIDETLVQNFSVPINLDSGVHYIQFSAENYKTAGTTYYFQGNTNYKIDVVLENAIKGEMYITNSEEYKEENFASKITNFIFPEQPYKTGTFYINGIEAFAAEETKSKISINGNSILGQFITEDGENSFFYIPENLISSNQLLYIKGEAFNRDEYIEKHRRQMYNAYSFLVVSLIPHFIAKGQYETQKTPVWKIANIGCNVISIGCGAWMIYELIRYFIAADSVIPEKPRVVEKNYKIKDGAEKAETEIKQEEQ